ncbi:MAG: trypsin-like peptidase domain-containing protein [Chloroflexi bacterium]|nr:trypsin-like peptidase domain-containing protein [Chloroflexota bacterium]
MKRLLRTIAATTVVSFSMTLGTTLGLVYAWYLTPAMAGRISPVRLEAPLSRDGEVTKAAIFDEREVVSVYERAGPAVVTITVTGANPRRAGLGSGSIIRPDGVVLTNYHVVRDAVNIEVGLTDQVSFVAKLVGADPQNDLAVLRLVDAPGNLPVIPLGESKDLRPGALAIAIGNPNRLERSVTVGVISGLNRTLRETERPMRNVIQTDAAINQGNSGGPLLDARGELVGITTAIEAVSGQRGFGGIGYAVPAEAVTRALERMLAGETIEHAWLGVSGQDVTRALVRERGLKVQSGAFVADTVEGAPAREAGIQPGDVLTAINGKPVRSMDELGQQLDELSGPGDIVTIALVRGSERLELPVRLAAWPESTRQIRSSTTPPSTPPAGNR